MEQGAGQTPACDQMSLTYLAPEQDAPWSRSSNNFQEKMSLQVQQGLLRKLCWQCCSGVHTSPCSTSTISQCLELAKSHLQERLEAQKLQRLPRAIGISSCSQPGEGIDFKCQILETETFLQIGLLFTFFPQIFKSL